MDFCLFLGKRGFLGSGRREGLDRQKIRPLRFQYESNGAIKTGSFSGNGPGMIRSKRVNYSYDS